MGLKTMKSTAIIMLTLALAFGLRAADISGRVIDAESGEPLYGVDVLIDGTRTGAVTNEKGLFEIKGVPDEELVISAGRLGYRVEKFHLNPLETEFVQVKLEPIYLSGEEVIITATRADIEKAPATFTNINARRIREDFYTQEFPLLIESTPGVFSYSDAGNGQGYTYLKIRGFDQKRISVMINGIPLNDPEDHQVYWVDMPDLAANVDDIQVQRGLGYSPYGPSSFGGSVNILTTPDPQARRIESSLGYGSFNTRKYSALFNSGLVDNTYQVYGRFSRITTDGYRDNSSFEGWSYYLSASRFGVDNALTINIYGGPEFLHAAWEATPEAILDTNRTYNPIQYENTVDNFNQPHYEIHHTLKLSDDINIRNTLFHIKGVGYWEIYKDNWGNGEPLFNYGLSTDPDAVSDLVQQQWVDKNQWGWIPMVSHTGDRWEWTAGGNFWTFDSHHYGKVIWVQNPAEGDTINPDHKDHDFNGYIWEGSVFAHTVYKPVERLRLIADLQYRHLGIEFKQNPAGAFSGAELNRYELSHNFLNPKVGASYELLEKMTGYASIGFAQREPSQREYWGAWVGPEDYKIDPLFARSDTIRVGPNAIRVDWSESLVEPEQMFDFELGVRYRLPKVKGSFNFYWMDFRNEVIPGGVYQGYQTTYNADRTLHRGIEAEALWRPIEALELSGNLSYSLNTFESDILSDSTDAGSSIKGNRIPLFPEVIGNGRVSCIYRSNAGWSAKPWLGMRYVGKQYLEMTNLEGSVVDPYGLMDLGVLVELPANRGRPELKIQAVVNNILDEEYETSGYYLGELEGYYIGDKYYYGNFYYPGAERNYYLGLTVGL